jgi:hypothetical protein
LDRFCGDCGYNLRTLAVYRDEHTGIPVVRCPECGRFQPANHAATALRPWLDRLTAFVLVCWVLSIISAVGFLGMMQGALTYANLDELTVHGGSTVQRIGNTTVRTWSSSYGPLEVKQDVPYYAWFAVAMLGISFALGLSCAGLVVVACPHWHRAAYLALALSVTLAANAVVMVAWRVDAPHLMVWALPYVAAHAAAQCFGGLAGVMFGRPVARLIVRIVLPPGIRPRLAYLWHADGKPFPRPATKARAGDLHMAASRVVLPEPSTVG